MAWPLWAALAATTYLRNQQQKQQYEADMELAAETQRNAPWTGNQAQIPGRPDYMGNIMQAGMTGAMMSQGFGKGTEPAGKVTETATPSVFSNKVAYDPMMPTAHTTGGPAFQAAPGMSAHSARSLMPPGGGYSFNKWTHLARPQPNF